AERYMSNYADSALRHYELLNDYHKDIKGYERYQLMSQMLAGDKGAAYRQSWQLGHPWGTPEQVIETVSQRAHESGASEITFVFKYGGMPLPLAQRSLRLFAEQVLPGDADDRRGRWHREHGDGIQHIGFWVEHVVVAAQSFRDKGASLLSARKVGEDNVVLALSAFPSSRDALEAIGPNGITYLD